MTGSWRDNALCQQIATTETFYPGKGESARAAKQVCSMCPVKAPCLSEALATAEVNDHGIWGGTSAFERRKLRRGQPAATATVWVLPVSAPTVEQPRRAA